MSRYGLNLRVQPKQNVQAKRPPRPPLGVFRDDDNEDDDDGVERDISRQAMKSRSRKDIEEQHKKALEEDPSAFDYDEVYDEMKEEVVRPRIQDRQEKKPKYIQTLIDKAKEREREHEIIYERKLAKERTKDEHLYMDKDKFITGAYKRKLAEQAKFLEQDRLQQRREEKEDVTKKDLSEFYFNLDKNVAFGADDSKARKAKQAKSTVGDSPGAMPADKSAQDSSAVKLSHQGEGQTSSSSKDLEPKHENAVADTTQHQDSTVSNSTQDRGPPEQPPLADQQKTGHHKRNDDAVSAAKERFLARKRAKEQELLEL